MLRGSDLNGRPSGYACYYDFHHSCKKLFCGFVVWTFPSSLASFYRQLRFSHKINYEIKFTIKMPAIKSLHLQSLLQNAFSSKAYLQSVASAKDWLGITALPASPNLTGCHARISLRAAQSKINSHASLYREECGFL